MESFSFMRPLNLSQIRELRGRIDGHNCLVDKFLTLSLNNSLKRAFESDRSTRFIKSGNSKSGVRFFQWGRNKTPTQDNARFLNSIRELDMLKGGQAGDSSHSILRASNSLQIKKGTHKLSTSYLYEI